MLSKVYLMYTYFVYAYGVATSNITHIVNYAQHHTGMKNVSGHEHLD
jgi:hypothetical protein